MKKLILLFLLLATSAFAADNSAPYYIPPTQMNALIEVMDMGYARDFGMFRAATGSFNFDDTAKSLSNLRIAIDSSSLIAANNDIQRGLAILLGNYQYPEIRIMAPDTVTFTDNKAQIKATVLLHGASRQITFDAVLNKTGKTTRSNSMWSNEGEAVGLSLKGDIKRADFGMIDSPDAPAIYGDTITFILEIQAIKQ